jgi:hypothetical protein
MTSTRALQQRSHHDRATHQCADVSYACKPRVGVAALLELCCQPAECGDRVSPLRIAQEAVREIAQGQPRGRSRATG